MLDETNVLQQRDPSQALKIASEQYQQTEFDVEIKQKSDAPVKNIQKIVVAGMGGSALAALLAKVWLKDEIKHSFEVVRGYSLPQYTNQNTLVVVSSYSGNTEEALSCLEQALSKQATVAIIASGGQLIEQAESHQLPYVLLPKGFQPRYGVIYNLKAVVALLAEYQQVSQDKVTELTNLAGWLKQVSADWDQIVPAKQNYAKQLAQEAVGKTAIFYGGELTSPVAYKWKISWNENAKNVAFWNEYPEFNHNEFMGWGSHPIEKPFAVFDLISHLEHSQILKRFEVTDRLLSGLRPKATTIKLEGDTLLKQLLWGSILADFVSIYLAILNNVDPTPVALIEKLKAELK